jgi:Fe-S cluster assembly iron-binding protein IscA
MLSNKLADLIWTLSENNKSQKAAFNISLVEAIDKTLTYTLTYVDTETLYQSPFLTVENATIKVVVGLEDLNYFIDSCTAKGITLNLVG